MPARFFEKVPGTLELEWAGVKKLLFLARVLRFLEVGGAVDSPSPHRSSGAKKPKFGPRSLGFLRLAVQWVPLRRIGQGSRNNILGQGTWDS